MTAPAYILRDATPNDAEWVGWLEEHCMRPYAEALWGDWHPAMEKQDFDSDCHRIVAVEGIECGVIDVRKRDAHHYLSRLYLVEHVRGRGLGAALLKQVREEAAAAGLPVRLSVVTSNPRAKTFYEREGFSVVEQVAHRVFMERWD